MYLISYDIEDDTKRTKISELLKDYGTRVQYSVFEVDVDKEKLCDIKKRLIKIFENNLKNNDRLRVYDMCLKCIKNREIHGKDINEVDDINDEVIVV